MYSIVPLGLNSVQNHWATIEGKSQPWKSFWPPNSIKDPTIWEESEFPEVSSWIFDPTSALIDRPWRKWTRTTRAKIEKAEKLSHAHDLKEVSANEDQAGEIPCGGQFDTLIHTDQMKVVFPVLNYLAPLGIYQSEKPYLSRLPALSGLTRTNILEQSYPVQIFEISGHERLFTLDEAGFEFTHFAEAIHEWSDSAICSTYIPKLSVWLKQYLSCSEVHIYAYSFRGRDSGSGTEKPWKTPFFRAHCDATAASCFKRLQLYVDTDPETLLRSRVRFLNVWRPLTTPVQDSPLALCDHRTVSPSDLVPTDIVFPHYLDEAYEVLYNPNQRWLYRQGMNDGDVILFKLADSAKNVATLCPHSAFADPSIPKDSPERVSVEVRAIIIG